MENYLTPQGSLSRPYCAVVDSAMVVFCAQDLYRVRDSRIKNFLLRKTMMPMCMFDAKIPATSDLVTPKSYTIGDDGVTPHEVYIAFVLSGLPAALLNR